MHESVAPVWLKSQRCESGDCVEVAAMGAEIMIRDSKNPAGLILRLSRQEWDTFTTAVARGDFRFN